MLPFERLRLALWGIMELQRQVILVNVELLLLLLLLLLLPCLKGWRALEEYIGYLRPERMVLMNGRQTELLLMLGQKGLRLR